MLMSVQISLINVKLGFLCLFQFLPDCRLNRRNALLASCSFAGHKGLPRIYILDIENQTFSRFGERFYWNWIE